jgi:hypothetical protein
MRAVVQRVKGSRKVNDQQVGRDCHRASGLSRGSIVMTGLRTSSTFARKLLGCAFLKTLPEN